jgi:glutamyl/glutaminyl-tRNA synthetase
MPLAKRCEDAPVIPCRALDPASPMTLVMDRHAASLPAAPSPTGTLHVGNLRTALHNWMFAKAKGGRFLLRIDDTDRERSEERHVTSIRADLAWLGLAPDGEERQSARFDRYEARFAELVAAGRIYPAYETAQELDLKRKVLLGRGLPPIYDRAALALSDAERAAFEAEGRTPHWRFRLDHDAPIEWDDLVRGHQRFDPGTMSDPVIRRADGSWLYLFPSVVDDVDMAITHVVRGEDHVSNTATQLQMFDALGSSAARASRTRRCSSATKASSPSGSARSASIISARRASSRRLWSPCSRGSAPAIPSSLSSIPRR